MARLPEEVQALRRGLGTVLRSYREASPLDQTAIGRITAYSRTSISHIESGRQFPPREFWEVVDQALEANGDLLERFDQVVEGEKQIRIAELGGGQVRRNAAAQLPPHDDDWLDDVNRRELLRLVAATGSMLAVPAIDVDRVLHAAERPRRIDPTTLDSYSQLNASLWEEFRASRNKRDVLPVVRGQLNALHVSLNEIQSSVARRRLCALAGDLFQLCGEVFFDCDQYADAAQCYAEAAHASKEAREPDLWACAMTRHAFIGIYERRYQRSVPLLDGAARVAALGDPNRATRYWVAAVQAQAYAGIGDLRDCQRGLDKAEEVLCLGESAPSAGWLRFDGTRLEEERAACFVKLRRPDLAEPALDKALGEATSARRRGSVLVDLAIVGAQRGDVDQLVLNGAAAVDSARRTASAGYLGRKLADLREGLSAYSGDRHVRYLDSQIREVVSSAGMK